MSFRESLSNFWGNTQQLLFPYLERDIGILSDKYKQLVAIFELIRIEEFLPCTRFNLGRPIRYRRQIARAFIAKAVLKITYTKQLVRPCCINARRAFMQQGLKQFFDNFAV